MKRWLGVAMVVALAATAAAESGETERFAKATKVLTAMASGGAAGPNSLHEGVGTDGRFKAEIFSYAKASGFFAGVSFEGSSLTPDGDAIRRVYGPQADSRDVLLGTKYKAPAAAGSLMTALRGYAPPPKKKP